MIDSVLIKREVQALLIKRQTEYLRMKVQALYFGDGVENVFHRSEYQQSILKLLSCNGFVSV